MMSYYEVLGVDRKADGDQIKKAYRKLALKWHPDKNRGKEKECQRRFQIIQQAYEVIRDGRKRALYDKHRDAKEDKERKGKRKTAREHLCPHCQKAFGHAWRLRRHVDAVHLKTQKKDHRCPHCPKAFSWASHLHRHLTVHTDERQFKCDQCGVEIKDPSCFRVHQRSHNKGEKPYRCAECGSGFNRAGTLSRHLRTHVPQRPFQCDKCDRRFARKDDVMKHKRRMHSSI